MFEELTSFRNLYLAFQKASKGKRGLAYVAGFEHRLEDNLCSLQEQLRQKTYQPGQYNSFTIHEPKRRLISAAPFRDRVVHHALCNLMEPVFERSFISDSYANRIEKGTHRALNRCQYFARRYAYFMLCDIKQFFPSVDHLILKQIITHKIENTDVLWLIDVIMASGEGILQDVYDMVYFPGDDLFALNCPRGLPIGNLTSQFWANVYMNPFDHFVKRQLRCTGYLRYVDDCVFFSNDKRELWFWLREVKKRLQRYRLTIHPGSHPRPVSEGIPFLGFIVFPERRRLKPRKGVHFQRKLTSMLSEFSAGKLSAEEMTASVRGWINHVRYGNTVGLRKAILRQTKHR